MTQTIMPFEFAPMPLIHFGWGIRHKLIESIQQSKPEMVVLITSKTLAHPGEFGDVLFQTFESFCEVKHFIVSGEPSPEVVDNIVKECDSDSDMVIGLGGGSVLDAAKAVAGLLPSQTSVMDYLEGVGAGKPFHVETCPFIAIPTTAGTGSETTKNAVLSRIGYFKKSFRDNKLLAKQAWLDPELLISCPKDVLYSTGMDAFTQLLESYTTLKPNPITDALAWQGMTLFKDAFSDIDSNDEQRQKTGYSNLMLAASLSGTTLANAGLGAVHGLAGPIGAFFEAPHGIVCARLLAPITQANIESLQALPTQHALDTLLKYEQVSLLLNPNQSANELLPGLVTLLEEYAIKYTPQGLADFGLTTENITPVIENCRSGSMLGNSVTLSDSQLIQALHKAI
ncbi:alcohol dehydrogenase [Thiomicrorhabdus immobilis]|uniref:Alcohol dehydrogenase n=1 Tax=Thiomicrorhabdus immobilis TaxID=2791037 RepID=A0ABM7MAY2_9GAMM|nr:iron-containing alcohol dehydrogenase [Thiomicrorhabdus immobilis]BCN92471.1 alcohol dehydrogenase [Thiomicrorhabdus immobilis]